MTELQLYAPPMKNFLNISILFTFMFIYILYLVTYNSNLQRAINTQSKIIRSLTTTQESSSQTVDVQTKKKFLIPSYHVVNFAPYLFYNSTNSHDACYDTIYGYRVKKDEDFPGYYTFAECKTGKILKRLKSGYTKIVDFENPNFVPDSWYCY